MQLTKKIIFLTLLSFVGATAKPQSDIINIDGPKHFATSANLPSDILSSKSIFVYNPLKDAAILRQGWKKLGEQSHETFRRAGIDVVAYYHLHDMVAGSAASNAIVASLTSRGISNLIILNHEIDGRRGKEEFKLVITPFNNKTTLVDQGQAAYAVDGAALDVVMLTLYRKAAKGLERKSLLITENPEYFEDADLISGQRHEKFPVDLRVLKIAVKLQSELAIPENANDALTNQLRGANTQIARNNQQLQDLLEAYPLKYEWVNGNVPDEELRSKGVQFVLHHLNTSAEVIRRMLNYPMDEEQVSYVSTVYQAEEEITRTLPADQTVHKYYVKHVITGDAYLGTEWDADLTWQSSLTNFMTNLRKELKLNP